jgi:hypothetical protein
VPRRQTRPRPPAAHLRGGVLVDPTDYTLHVDLRLLSARAILTKHVRALDAKEAEDRRQRRADSDPLAHPNAPHKLWMKTRQDLADDGPGDQDQLDADIEDIEDLLDLAGPDADHQPDQHSGKTALTHPRDWPDGVLFGDDPWKQLRWRPRWRLDEGQSRMDRFELGHWWWEAIYDDPRFCTERKFEVWRNAATNGLRGVVWAAPTADGRLEEPALARVVVCTSRRRRVGIWPLLLPNPEWSAQAQGHYVAARVAGQYDWQRLSAEADAITQDPDHAAEMLATSIRQRQKKSRRSRRSNLYSGD